MSEIIDTSQTVEKKEIPPGQLLRDRYIPIEDVESVCGIKVAEANNLIKNKVIRYAEFTKPGAYKRTIHVDPVEIENYLSRANRG